MVGKSFFSVCEKASDANRWILFLWKIKVEKTFRFCDYQKDSAFTAVERDAKPYTRYVKGVPFVNRRVNESATFSVKSSIVYRKVGDLDLAAEPSRIKLRWITLHPHPPPERGGGGKDIAKSRMNSLPDYV